MMDEMFSRKPKPTANRLQQLEESDQPMIETLKCE